MAWFDRVVARVLNHIPGLGEWLTERSLGNEPKNAPPLKPFVPFGKTDSETRIMLITTGGVHLPDQEPFDMENSHGDISMRVIPRKSDRLNITHDYFDSRDARRDINCLFPLGILDKLVTGGVIGSLTEYHLSLMGHIEDPLLPEFIDSTLPEILDQIRQESQPPDLILLAPA